MTSLQAPGATPPEPNDDLFDFAQLRDYALFVKNSVLRNRRMFWIALGSGMAVAILAVLMLPRSYHVESKILAQQNQVIASLGNPNRAVPRDSDAPTRAATETILRRDNLVSLIKQTDLLDQWDNTRAPALRAKDFVLRLFRGAPAEEDRLDALVGLLEKRLQVVIGEGTVSIIIDWPDADMSFRLVEAAQQNFLEARHVSEISSISEAIGILEGHASGVRDVIDGALDRIQRHKVSQGERQRSPAGPKTNPALSHERDQLVQMLTAKRRAMKDLEDFRLRRMSELQAKLSDLRVNYADSHPEVVHTKQSIEGLGRSSMQIQELKRDEETLVAELDRIDKTISEEAARPPEKQLIPDSETTPANTPADPEKEAQAVEFAKARMNVAIAKYDELLERIDSAKIELATSRAAFKYRYSVIRPAQRPKSASKPNVPLVLLFGLIGSAGLGLVASVLTDVRRGKIIESWQISRILGIPVIAEVNKP